jgi:hypothetical protein
MRQVVTIFLVSLLGFSLLACRGIRGSGTIIEKEVPISMVRSVSLSASGDVRIIIGDEEKLLISGDDNIIELLDTEVRDGHLELGRMRQRGTYIQSSKTIEFTVYVRQIEALNLAGSGEINVENTVNAERFELTLSGSGNIIVQAIEAEHIEATITGSGDAVIRDGKVNFLNVGITGSGRFDGRGLAAISADVAISGSGDVYTRVEENLAASVTGSGDVEYWGRPTVSSQTTGSGSVVNRGS